MPITAHFEDPPGGPGQSRARRRVLQLEAEGALGTGEATRVLIHNVSAGGLLIETATALAEGETIAIDLPLAGQTPAEVIWASGTFYGCRFAGGLPLAVLSAMQLRAEAAPLPAQLPSRPAPIEALREESFSARLERLRKMHGLSLARIGRELGVSKPTVWAWEQGKARPTESRIEPLAALLGVDPSELVTGRDSDGLRDVLTRAREQIATAFGTKPGNVRIMIEL